MDVRIGAVVAIAKAIVNEVQTNVEILNVVPLKTPSVSRSYFYPVISINGTSISSVNPELISGGYKAIA